MKKILLPTDFSENSWNAIQYAISLFKEKNCVFYLLHTYTPAIANHRFMASALHGGNIEDGLHTASQRGLKKMVQRIKETYDLPNHQIETVSSFSLLTDIIQELVTEKDIDLIVTGTKGATGLDEVFMGSNTVRMIKTIKSCPILVIPQHFEFEIPTEIAFATDFTRFYTLAELGPLIKIAQAFKATIRIVYVQHGLKALNELQQFNLNMLRKYFDSVEHYVHTVSELNSVANSLEIFASELNIHLLAMLNYQHSYLETLTREPVVRRIAFHTEIPLLVIPELGMHVSSKKKKNNEMSITN
jgi:nucleotide-binding universal stress UspA family protein